MQGRDGKTYIDEDGNWVVPIADDSTKFIDGKIEMFGKHAVSVANEQCKVAIKARNANLSKGGNRGLPDAHGGKV